MLRILEVTTPIYLLIALGFLAVSRGWMEISDMRSLGRFVARFGLPALIYRAIASQPIASILDARYLTMYCAGSLASLLIIRFIAGKIRHRVPPRVDYSLTPPGRSLGEAIVPLCTLGHRERGGNGEDIRHARRGDLAAAGPGDARRLQRPRVLQRAGSTISIQ